MHDFHAPADQAFIPPPRVPSPVAQRATASASPPDLYFGDTRVEPERRLAPGTGFYMTLGWIVFGLVAFSFVVGTAGGGLLMLAAGAIAERWMRKRRRALLKGSGVLVGPDQLPFIYHCVQQFSRRLGMKEAPEVYVVEAAVQNGFAFKIGRRNVVLLTDDAIWGALQSHDPRALGFILGHELGHIALGHTTPIRGMIRQIFRPLSRLDELSADNIAKDLVGDPRLAVAGLTVLTVGPQLLPFVNQQALARQAREVLADKQSKKAERVLSHPLLLRRVANLMDN